MKVHVLNFLHIDLFLIEYLSLHFFNPEFDTLLMG
jgi:hypothetical protein